MSHTKAPISLSVKFDRFIDKPSAKALNLSSYSPAIMWRNIAKQISSKALQKQNLSLNPKSRYNRTSTFLSFPQGSNFPEKLVQFSPFDPVPCSNNGSTEFGFRKFGEFLPRDEFLSRPVLSSGYIGGFSWKSYASVAEAVEVSSSEAEENVSVTDEVEELLAEMRREEKKQFHCEWRKRQRVSRGMGRWKYQALKRRQTKIETEAWEKAAKEYKELLEDMCAQKLAPNLPYMKSLFLGWFEPLHNKIAEEQELYLAGKTKANYLKYFNQLPADMVAVVTMHKLMGLLMAGGEFGTGKVVHIACAIGDAIEQEVKEFSCLIFISMFW